VVTDTYTYDAFGKLIARTGATPNAYLYAGERFDADLGLYHLRARHYDVDRGRFTSMDPFAGYIDEPASLHKYLYVHADPVNLIDPEGLSVIETSFLQRMSLGSRAAYIAIRKFIECVFLRAASWLASTIGFMAWMIVRNLAARLGLVRCVCKPGNVSPVRGTLRQWLRDAPDLLQLAIDGYNTMPEWQGINPDKTPVRYRPGHEVQEIRESEGRGRRGHHPHPLALDGPPGQDLTPTGERRRGPKNPSHNRVHKKVFDPITSLIKNMCVR
jgi:RHS repeat-associated protein